MSSTWVRRKRGPSAVSATTELRRETQRYVPSHAAQPQLRPAALGGGTQQGADVLGVDQVGEGVPAQYGGGAAEQPAQGVVGAEQPAVLVAAHLGDGHAAGRVLEGLAEGLLAGPQRLLFAFESDQGALHVCSQASVTDRNGGLGGVHLERLAPPRAGAAPIARPVDGYDPEEVPPAPGGVHGGVEPVQRVPLVLEPGLGALGVPLRHVVVEQDPALGVGYEPQLVPGLAHGEAGAPRSRGSRRGR